MNIIDNISNDFNKFLKENFEITQDLLDKCSFDLNIDPAKANFGDINSNCAMILTKHLKTNPREIAKKISSNFTHDLIEKIEIAGPGFLNIFLKNDAYQKLIENISKTGYQFFKPEKLEKKKYNIEFVSANPTGPIHFGHGRGGIIGDVLGNILKFLGHDVTKEYYINDAGAQIKKLEKSFKVRLEQALQDKQGERGQEIQMPEDAYHGEYLQELAKKTLEKFGPEILEKDDIYLANYAKEKMLEMIRKTVSDYGITFDVWFSEKTLHDSGAITKSLEILTKRGYLYKKDDALWFKSTEFGDDKDRVIIKSNGEPTYAAPDIAYLENKAERGFDHILMMLGHDHHSYAVRLESFRKALGLKAALNVILFQLVKMKEGNQKVRMSKRAGNIVTLDDIIKTVGKDVARFFYLNRKADAQLEFDLDLALKKSDENPVYYIQYAYVRTRSILEKAKLEEYLNNINSSDAIHINQSEHAILKKIISLKQVLENIGQNFQTHILAYYTIELAIAFHSYYNKNRVIVSEKPDQSRGRLLLIKELKKTFELCLDLLGLSKPEKM